MITRTVVRSGGGGGSGSSFPGAVKYFSGVAVNKLGVYGPDAAITGLTSFLIKIIMPTASADISTETQLVGCISMLTDGILQASDGTNVSPLPVPGGWSAGDELLICLTVDPVAETMILWRVEA